jgi:hypothetical protein
VGKSTVAAMLVDRLPGWRLFDPEIVGSMLKAHLVDHPVIDFQDWPAWRKLVAPIAAAVARQTEAFVEARHWLEGAPNLIVDTSDLDPKTVVDRVLAAVA